MTVQIPFLSEKASRINEVRTNLLQSFLPNLVTLRKLKTALDIGCGPGFFCHLLSSMGLKVAGVDIREENLIEAQDRFPGITFIKGDIEQGVAIDKADFVLALGLFYHLENPISALRNVAALSKEFLFIESMVAPHKTAIAKLFKEPEAIDQGIGHFALIPSTTLLIHVLRAEGFTGIYEPKSYIPYSDFFSTPRRHQRRRLFLASRDYLGSSIKLGSVTFVEYRAPNINYANSSSWNTALGNLLKTPSYIKKLFCGLSVSWAGYLPIPGRLGRKARYLVSSLARKISSHFSYNFIYKNILVHAYSDDIFENRLFLSKNYEPEVLDYMNASIKPEQTVFIDIGAHHGIHSIYAIKNCKAKKVISFEPSSRERERLLDNTRRNRLKNIVVSSCAISKSNGSATLNIADSYNNGHNSLENFRYPETKLEKSEIVQTITLRELFDRYSISPHDHTLIKIDVEGHEMEILRTAEETLKEFAPDIIIEVSKETYGPIKDSLLKLGYTQPQSINIKDTANLVFLANRKHE